MYRHAMAAKVKEGQFNAFRKALGSNWDKIVKYLDSNRISNFSIWTAKDLLFCYFEKENEGLAKVEGEFKALLDAFSDTIDFISTPGEDMRLMYHDFGVVRTSKDLIRIRMFMTKLKEGQEEEYKARHDKLVEARGDKVTPGPDSNFSIWNAGGYIFGYDEIDTTMEVEETKEDRENTIAWETRQLGIMDWITNDVDWMTGEVHEQSRCIAKHI